jgi:hypothetical protein
MFKRLLLLSGLLAAALTAWVYVRHIRPVVDVTKMEAGAVFTVADSIGAATGEVTAISGKVTGAGMTLLGKPELSLADSSGARMVLVTLVSGHPTDGLTVGGTVVVKGVWQPITASDEVMTVLGRLTDAVVMPNKALEM